MTLQLGQYQCFWTLPPRRTTPSHCHLQTLQVKAWMESGSSGTPQPLSHIMALTGPSAPDARRPARSDPDAGVRARPCAPGGGGTAGTSAVAPLNRAGRRASTKTRGCLRAGRARSSRSWRAVSPESRPSCPPGRQGCSSRTCTRTKGCACCYAHAALKGHGP